VALLDVVLARPLQLGQQLQEDGHAMSTELTFHLRLGSCGFNQTLRIYESNEKFIKSTHQFPCTFSVSYRTAPN
jgi:hypothetical protein